VHVPLVDLKVQTRELHDEFDAARWPVIDRAAYTMGPEFKEPEIAFATFCGCECAVA
jgi:hypothetical protein